MARAVAPFAGAWIEIGNYERDSEAMNKSLPSRERGLKSDLKTYSPAPVPVAPFAGAWIEISRVSHFSTSSMVAPFAGAWIEIVLHAPKHGPRVQVAPFAGAWIEIGKDNEPGPDQDRRSLRGSVD